MDYLTFEIALQKLRDGRVSLEYVQQQVIDEDQTGRFCTLFAAQVPGADIPLLAKKVIEKDTTGEWCGKFAWWVDCEWEDTYELKKALDRKDTGSAWTNWFVLQLFLKS